MNLQTAAQHAELMRRVETLNLLQDSNKLMREEKQRMAQQLRDLEAKVSAGDGRSGDLGNSSDFVVKRQVKLNILMIWIKV